MLVLGVDPDSNGSGWAIVGGDPPRVQEAGIFDSRGNTWILGVEKQIMAIRELAPQFPEVDVIAVEYPQHYRNPYQRYGAPMKVNPNHLMMIASIGGAVAGSARLKEGGEVSLLRPAVWKGQRSKGATHRYVCRVVKWKYGLTSHPGNPLTEVIPHEDTKFHAWKGSSCKPWSEVLDAIGVALYELKKRHP